jgi:ribosomal protein L14E/L6E/L27E
MVELKPGQLVRSLVGRDKGKHYLVLQELDQRNVLLVDGRSRTLAKPKKKNKAHLQHYDRRADLGEPDGAEKLNDSLLIRLLKEIAPVEGTPDEEV